MLCIVNLDSDATSCSNGLMMWAQAKDQEAGEVTKIMSTSLCIVEITTFDCHYSSELKRVMKHIKGS